MKKASSPIVVTFLGTNGWYDSATGYTPSVLVELKTAYVIFDAGNGLARLDAHITSRKPIFIFLSHLHLDHVAGLHVLAKFRFKQGMTLVIPKVFVSPLRRLLKQPFSVPLDQLPYPVRLEILRSGTEVPFGLSWERLDHSSPCWGYRITQDAASIVYATDTGICAGYKKLIRGADLLITECSYLPGETHSEWPHLNPEDSACAASEMGVKRLVLMHFDAFRYPTMTQRRHAGLVAKTRFKNTQIAHDGMQLYLET